MPYANLSDRRAQQQRYAQTPQGRAARQRAHHAYTERRRMLRAADRAMQINPAPLAQALEHWKHQ